MSCDHRKYPLPPRHAIVAYNIVQSAAIYQEPLTLFPFHWIPRPLCIRAIENRSTISNIGSTLCDNINVNYPRQPKNNNLYYISHTERKSEFRLYIFFPSFFINKLLIGYFFFFFALLCLFRPVIFVCCCLPLIICLAPLGRLYFTEMKWLGRWNRVIELIIVSLLENRVWIPWRDWKQSTELH